MRIVQQDVRYFTTSDGVRLAYSIVGSGTPIVRTPHWFAHLENDLRGPVFRPQILGLAYRHRLLRYDARGVGMSQRDGVNIAFERIVEDLLEAVDHVGFDRFVLVGLSQGGAVAAALAARHPERVSHLIIYGAFARGMLKWDDTERQRERLETLAALIRDGWGSDADAYREFFTSQFIVDGTIEQHKWLNYCQRIAATPEIAEKILRMNAAIDVRGILPQIKVPTLVLHATEDMRVPFWCGEEFARNIPNAKFVTLQSRNHILVADESASREFFDAVSSFLGDPQPKGALPGTATMVERLERRVGVLEKSWIMKIVVILAAVTGVILFFQEMLRDFYH